MMDLLKTSFLPASRRLWMYLALSQVGLEIDGCFRFCHWGALKGFAAWPHICFHLALFSAKELLFPPVLAHSFSLHSALMCPEVILPSLHEPFQLFYSHNVSSFLRKIQSSLFECYNSESLHTVIRTKRSQKVGGFILSGKGIGLCFSLNDSFNLNQSWVVLAMEQEAAGGGNRV